MRASTIGPATGRPRQRRWPWYLLVASLAGNMLLGGAFAAMLLHPPPPPHHGPMRGFEAFVERASRRLPPDDAALLRQAFEAERPSLVRMEATMDELRRRLRAGILAQPFDPDALRRAFDEAHATEAELRQRFDVKAIETLSRMSAEGRRRLLMEADDRGP